MLSRYKVGTEKTRQLTHVDMDTRLDLLYFRSQMVYIYIYIFEFCRHLFVLMSYGSQRFCILKSFLEEGYSPEGQRKNNYVAEDL